MAFVGALFALMDSVCDGSDWIERLSPIGTSTAEPTKRHGSRARNRGRWHEANPAFRTTRVVGLRSDRAGTGNLDIGCNKRGNPAASTTHEAVVSSSRFSPMEAALPIV